MEFRICAGDGGLRRPSSRLSHHFTPRAGPGHFPGGPPPPPPQIEWEAAARRERIIREEVERRLIEEEVCRGLAIARARLHGGLGPEPFFRPNGPFVPLPPGPLFGVDVPFMPPTRPPPMPAGMRMHPNGRSPASLGPWQGYGSRRCSGFGQRKLLGEARRKTQPPKPKHKLKLLKVEPNESSEVLSSETKVSSVKIQADAISVTTASTPSSEAKVSGVKRNADVIAAATGPTKLQKVAQDWSCALCQVCTTSEDSLNTHLQGKKHKAKLAQCGVIKAIGGYENGFQATTGNKDSGCPIDASRKIYIVVDGVMHEVVQKSNYLWCEHCRVRCESNMTMAGHLRGKKHSELNKVWKSIKAVRLNKSKEGSAATCKKKVNASRKICIEVDGVMHEVVQKSNYLWCERCRIRCENNMTMAGHLRGKKHSELNKVWKSIKAVRLNKSKEGSAATCKKKVNENGPIRIPEEGKKEDSCMANENDPVEIHVEMKKETTHISEVNENSPTETPVEIKKEDTDIASQVNGHIEFPMETNHEATDMASEVNEGNSHVEVLMDFKQEVTDMVMDVSRNGFIEIPVKDMKEAADVTTERNGNCFF